MKSIGIGRLAHRAGVSADTVRFYERKGLMEPSARLASGYRRYGEQELTRLRFIRRTQALGFTLKEIGELLRLSGRSDIGRLKRSAQAKLADVERRIAALHRMRSELTKLIHAPPSHRREENSPLVQALGRGPEE